jgi:hypothetical protein
MDFSSHGLAHSSHVRLSRENHCGETAARSLCEAFFGRAQSY